MGYVSVKLSDETYRRLVELKGVLESKLKRTVSIDEVVRSLVKGPVKVEGGRITYNLRELVDGVFYEVEYKGDRLLIGKRGGKLVIYSVPP